MAEAGGRRRRSALVVGISGASSSGKTTLARLLRDVFPNTFVLHQDDFYRPESELPTRDGLLDWDCAEALDIPALARALEHIRAEGTFPPFVDSKEDQNSVGACPVPAATIAASRARVDAWWAALQQQGHPLTAANTADGTPPRVWLLDGFLLYDQYDNDSSASSPPRAPATSRSRASGPTRRATSSASCGPTTPPRTPGCSRAATRTAAPCGPTSSPPRASTPRRPPSRRRRQAAEEVWAGERGRGRRSSRRRRMAGGPSASTST
ncbi:hypothetical protein GGR56DRAFT_634401 [Xylariaceae sp. FL0804]|nr:hypothetical protein GGR56DRAFT_634401 [Xylariaceae sp. FL0804]